MTDALAIDVTGGEQDWDLATWARMIDMRAVDVVQPDVMYMGGIARTLRVVRMAAAAGLPCTPHSANLSLVTICTMHLLGAIPNPGKYLEFSIEGLDYYPWQEGLFLGDPFAIEDGCVSISARAGLGRGNQSRLARARRTIARATMIECGARSSTTSSSAPAPRDAWSRAGLSQNGKDQVLLLEAGGSDRRFWIRVPVGYGRTFADPRVNWMYRSEPDPALAGRRGYWPRGKVLGGSGSINGMVYVRGLSSDFDGWRALGNPGWGFSDVLPYFKMAEDYCDTPDPAEPRPRRPDPHQRHVAGCPSAVPDVHRGVRACGLSAHRGLQLGATPRGSASTRSRRATACANRPRAATCTRRSRAPISACA